MGNKFSSCAGKRGVRVAPESSDSTSNVVVNKTMVTPTQIPEDKVKPQENNSSKNTTQSRGASQKSTLTQIINDDNEVVDPVAIYDDKGNSIDITQLRELLRAGSKNTSPQSFTNQERGENFTDDEIDDSRPTKPLRAISREETHKTIKADGSLNDYQEKLQGVRNESPIPKPTHSAIFPNIPLSQEPTTSR